MYKSLLFRHFERSEKSNLFRRLYGWIVDLASPIFNSHFVRNDGSKFENSYMLFISHILIKKLVFILFLCG
jgi:hypothetical protein